MPSLTIRKFDEQLDKKEDLIELLKPAFKNTWSRINEKWEWQYLNNPFSDGPLVYVAYYGDCLAGAIGCIPIKFSIRDKVVDAAWMVEAVTNPSFQRMGISMELHEKIEDDFTFVMAKSISDMILPLTKKRNYIYIPNAVYMVRILNLKNFIKERVLKKRRGERKTALQSDSRLPGLEIVTRFNEEYDGFAEKLCKKYDFIVLKTSEYMQWRYIDCPVIDYTVFRLNTNSRISGYVIVRISDDKGIKHGWIVDMLVDPLDSRSFNKMVEKCMTYFKRNDVSCVYTLGTHRYLKRKYYNNFFLPTKTHARIIAKNKKGMSDLIPDANLWYITEGDSDADLFR